MGKEGSNSLYKLILKTIVLEIIIAAAFIGLFSFLMYFADLDSNYASLLGTLSVAFSILITSFLLAIKVKKRGFLIGFIIGISNFVLIFLISLVINGGGITYNTLFHLIIFVLSGLIGGILGVNKTSNKKYF